MSVTSWFLVSSTGIRHRLPREMIFVGRDDCELMLQSRSVDKQHAVINYDNEKDEHWVKDLGSLNGTFVNDVRIPDQKYVTLKLNDVIRFGYDANMYVLEHIQHKVPEEALKHEKYTSQLQMSFKGTAIKRAEQPMEHGGDSESPQAKLEKGEKKTITETTTTYRTPLYGQPSWWGEDDANNKLESTDDRRPEEQYTERTKDIAQREEEINGNITGYRDSQGEAVYSFRREPSYFEIPTKEFQQPVKSPETQVHEIPTKDVDTTVMPVVQSHASFTIEFDDCTPGKIKIKDHVTKFSLRQRRNLGKEASHVEMISAENKVADWLVQNDPSLMRRQSPGDDVYSTKSDLPVHVRTLKGNRHEDGTQSDSEDPVAPKPEKEIPVNDHVTEQARLQRQIRRDPQELLHNQQAFVIEFFDDDTPRKKRSQSFTHSGHSIQNDVDPAMKTRVDKRKVTVPAEKPGSCLPSPHLPPVGTKGPSNSFSTPRAGSFKREKTEDRMSSSSSSTSRTSVKNHGSVGRKSKLSQDFAAELRESAQAAKTNAEKPPSFPAPLTPRVVGEPSSVPETIPVPAVDPALIKARKHEEEDSLSETGTYTIETESQDKEVEEARKMIDQVFGVLESPEFSRNSPAYRPVIKGEKDELGSHHLIRENGSSPKMTMMQVIASKVASGHHSDMQLPPASHGSQKWVSRWASLADTYTDSGSAPGTGDAHQQAPVSQAGTEKETSARVGESEAAVALRTRRLLPQLPPGDKSESPTPTILICHEPYPEVLPRNAAHDLTAETCGDPTDRLLIQEDLDPDSLSDASRSDDGFGLEKGRKSQNGTKRMEQEQEKPENTKSKGRQQAVPKLSCLRASSDPLSTSFYIGDEEEEGVPSKIPPNAPRTERDEAPFKCGKPAPRGLSNTYISSNGKMVLSLHQGLPLSEQEPVSSKEVSSFVRQESFTKEKSSSSVPHNRLPHISSHPLLKDLDVARASRMDFNQDTHLLLKDTETALAALEAKILCQTQQPDAPETPVGPLEDSLSGESDVDTSSTVSLLSGKNLPAHPPKRKAAAALQKEKSNSAPSVQDHGAPPSARERLSEKRKTLPPESGNKSENVKRFQVKRNMGASGSLEGTDDERSGSLPCSPATEVASSDQEQTNPSRPLSRKKPFSQSTKEEQSKVTPTAQKIQQVLTRSNSLSTPRPTRASKLRRARLGDTSDNESADTEKTASHPEGTAAPSKQPVETKKLSRLDILAMPRKRAGSFTVPSDSESTPPRPTFSGRSAESYYSTRKPPVSEARTAARKTAAVAASKQPLIRTRSSSVKYSSASTSRRRQQGSDYTSTSEEEYGSNHSSPKHKRSHTSTATQTPRTRGAGLNKQKHSNSRETEDEDFDDHDPYNFMAQTAEIAEIARLSQTLVKDVAILAREIHDVAGDGDSQSSSGTGPSTSHSSVPNTPASTISAREEVRQLLKASSLNYRKVPPGSMGFHDFDQNMNDNRDEDPTRKTRIRNREEVIFDNLMLNPVSQLSHTIRENTENLAEKMKILFQNTERSWEEIEAKINSENEVPILKTSNKEISSILKELRRVQKQLEVINAIIDPSGNLDMLANNKTSSLTPPSSASKVRTANNISGSVLEALSPVKKRSYTQKSNFGSTSLQDTTFVPDGDKYVI
nr:centrosomal protein of 170 kDa protein B [Pogona vitticeps]